MTKIYGASDDLVEFEGDVRGEVSHYGDGTLHVMCSDGTMLEVWYGDLGIWRIGVFHKGALFDRIDVCEDADADPHSDIAYFHDGLKRAYTSTEWQEVE